MKDFYARPFVWLPSDLVLHVKSIVRVRVEAERIHVWTAGCAAAIPLTGDDATAFYRWLAARSDRPRLEPAAARCDQRPAPAEAVTDDDWTLDARVGLGPAPLVGFGPTPAVSTTEDDALLARGSTGREEEEDDELEALNAALEGTLWAGQRA